MIGEAASATEPARFGKVVSIFEGTLVQIVWQGARSARSATTRTRTATWRRRACARCSGATRPRAAARASRRSAPRPAPATPRGPARPPPRARARKRARARALAAAERPAAREQGRRRRRRRRLARASTATPATPATKRPLTSDAKQRTDRRAVPMFARSLSEASDMYSQKTTDEDRALKDEKRRREQKRRKLPPLSPEDRAPKAAAPKPRHWRSRSDEYFQAMSDEKHRAISELRGPNDEADARADRVRRRREREQRRKEKLRLELARRADELAGALMRRSFARGLAAAARTPEAAAGRLDIVAQALADRAVSRGVRELARAAAEAERARARPSRPRPTRPRASSRTARSRTGSRALAERGGEAAKTASDAGEGRRGEAR